jgi:hypothetical protein
LIILEVDIGDMRSTSAVREADNAVVSANGAVSDGDLARAAVESDHESALGTGSTAVLRNHMPAELLHGADSLVIEVVCALRGGGPMIVPDGSNHLVALELDEGLRPVRNGAAERQVAVGTEVQGRVASAEVFEGLDGPLSAMVVAGIPIEACSGGGVRQIGGRSIDSGEGVGATSTGHESDGGVIEVMVAVPGRGLDISGGGARAEHFIGSLGGCTDAAGEPIQCGHTGALGVESVAVGGLFSGLGGGIGGRVLGGRRSGDRSRCVSGVCCGLLRGRRSRIPSWEQLVMPGGTVLLRAREGDTGLSADDAAAGVHRRCDAVCECWGERPVVGGARDCLASCSAGAPVEVISAGGAI